MKQFDYGRAWTETVKPAYDALPEEVHALLADTADAARDLHQTQDLGMPWPTAEPWIDLRARFEAIPSEVLAYAARVINNLGHWRPGKIGGPVGPLDSAPGIHWKFSHYADQVLRGRLGMYETADPPFNGWAFRVHEGAIRLCYSSRDMWTWHEVAPATEAGKAAAEQIKTRAYTAMVGIPDRKRDERDNAAYVYMEEVRKADHDQLYGTGPGSWPAAWIPIMGTDVYMTEPDAPGHGTAEQRQSKIDQARAWLLEHTAKKITELQETQKRMLWLLDHGILTDNAIWYSHRDIVCFGWREKVSPEGVSAILDVISEYPYEYEIKCTDGRTLSGRE